MSAKVPFGCAIPELQAMCGYIPVSALTDASEQAPVPASKAASSLRTATLWEEPEPVPAPKVAPKAAIKVAPKKAAVKAAAVVKKPMSTGRAMPPPPAQKVDALAAKEPVEPEKEEHVDPIVTEEPVEPEKEKEEAVEEEEEEEEEDVPSLPTPETDETDAEALADSESEPPLPEIVEEEVDVQVKAGESNSPVLEMEEIVVEEKEPVVADPEPADGEQEGDEQPLEEAEEEEAEEEEEGDNEAVPAVELVQSLNAQERQSQQAAAWKRLTTKAAKEPTTATDQTNKEFSKSPKVALEALQRNDPDFSILDLSGNTILGMKHREYCQEIAEALKTNTHIVEVHMARATLDATDAKALGEALEVNDSIMVLDLEKNKISNEGATALAQSLRKNTRLVELNLLGQPSQFGDSCLENFVHLFDCNVTLTKIIWRLDSRKSFAINKLIVRNNTIQKWLSEDKDVSAKIPKLCNVEELRLMVASKAVDSMTSAVEESTPQPAALAALKGPSASSTGSLWGDDSAAEESSEVVEANPVRTTNKFATLRSRPTSQTVKAVDDSAVEEPKPKFATLRSRPKSAMFSHKPESGDNSPVFGRNSSSDSPKIDPRFSTPSKAITAIEANDPELTVLLMGKNISFAMKHREYCERLGAALRTNTCLTEMHLSQCEIDNVSAKFLADGLAVNASVRMCDLSKNKIGNDGCQAIAEAFKQNCKINELNLFGQPSGFGESCLEVWLTALQESNISVRKIIWRLDSRKSFPINKLIVRNNTIKKWLDDGKSLEEGQAAGSFRVPTTANCSPESLSE